MRAAYRKLLRQSAALSRIYSDPNDVCFAVFGILIHPIEFKAGNYGSTPHAIIRACFDRPSIPDDPSDTSAARLAACLGFVRHFHDVELEANGRNGKASATPQLQRRRRRLSVREGANGIIASRQVSDADGNAGKPLPSSSLRDDPSRNEGRGRGGTPPQSEQDHSKSSVGGSSRTTSSSLSSSDSHSEPTPTRDEEEWNNEVSGTTLEEVTLYNGTFLIQRGSDPRSQKFYRHTVISKDRDSFPPYTFLLPPEPVYPRHTQHKFPCLVKHDIVHCLSASSYRVYQHFLKIQKPQSNAGSSTVCSGAKSSTNPGNNDLRPSSSSTSASSSLPPIFSPREASGVRAIPVASVALTDFVEVEIITRYLFPPPSASLFMLTSLKKGRWGSSLGVYVPELTPPSHGDGVAPSATCAPSPSTPLASPAPESNLFAYYLAIRNLDGEQNPEGWHIQVLSQHLVVLDVETGVTTEIAHPGVGGNFPTIRPGESHMYEGGTKIAGGEAILRGTLQVNAFTEDGQMRAFDVQIAPTRLSTRDSVYETPASEENPLQLKQCAKSVSPASPLPHPKAKTSIDAPE